MQASDATPNMTSRKDASVKNRPNRQPKTDAIGVWTEASANHLAYLRRGLSQPGGKLPLFDVDGQRINAQTIQECIEAGWCEAWYANPIKPDWLVCRLTKQGESWLRSAP